MDNKPHYNHGEFAEAPVSYVADLMENPDDIASATGATGLLPTPPMSAAEAESYNSLFAVPQQVHQVVPPDKPTGATKR